MLDLFELGNFGSNSPAAFVYSLAVLVVKGQNLFHRSVIGF